MILALTADLMFAARIRGTAEQVGAEVVLARKADELMQKARELAPSWIFLDLDSRAVDPVDLVRRLKADKDLENIPILGYVSHVNEQRINEARDAGIDQVMARGAFVKNLPAILHAKAPSKLKGAE